MYRELEDQGKLSQLIIALAKCFAINHTLLSRILPLLFWVFPEVFTGKKLSKSPHPPKIGGQTTKFLRQKLRLFWGKDSLWLKSPCREYTSPHLRSPNLKEILFLPLNTRRGPSEPIVINHRVTRGPYKWPKKFIGFHWAETGLLNGGPKTLFILTWSLTVRPWKVTFPKGKSSSNHHFSGANC